ncbi:unnamed protein product [Miscanthus lutarioriparius]|uniref:Uncharacterized protein n=1 Tax=Miscanthus lutarioriparius TaxID=422564 RepID=A0A811R735_9POAL|nr:unnamed protein product [Miscanthus lutarioriparius]
MERKSAATGFLRQDMQELNSNLAAFPSSPNMAATVSRAHVMAMQIDENVLWEIINRHLLRWGALRAHLQADRFGDDRCLS